MSTSASTSAVALRRTVVPRTNLLADSAFVVGGALLVAACAQIKFSLPFTPVPITLQTFGVLLTAAALGTVRGTLSMALYWVLGLGLPFYAGGESGWSVATGATGGYLIGFVVAGAVVGFLAERSWDREFRSSVSAMVTGTVIIYVCGLVWLQRWFASNGFDSSLEATLEAGLYPFVIGDVIKLYGAAIALPLAWRFTTRDR